MTYNRLKILNTSSANKSVPNNLTQQERSMIKDLYYLYQHIDPDSGEIVYVGIGTGSRAWATGTSSGSHRSSEHGAWITELYKAGYTMGDISKIVVTLLSKQQALTFEDEYIKRLKPRFNKLGNPDLFLNKKFNETEALEAYNLFIKGTPYYSIPKILNLDASNMSVLGSRMVEAGKRIINRNKQV